MDGDSTQGRAVPGDGAVASKAAAAGAVVDQALWSYLRPGNDLSDFGKAWLALQCQIIDGVTAAGLVMPDPDAGERFVPVAVWPDAGDLDDHLAATTEHAMAEQRGVLRELPGGGGMVSLAYPFLLEGRVIGAVTLRMPNRDSAGMRRIMRQLQWGAGWIELLDRRSAIRDIAAERDRGQAALDVVVTLLEAKDHKSAAMAVATSTAALLDMQRVSIGLLKGRKLKVVALSHTADLGAQLHLAGALRRAMLESLDQGAPILRSAARDEEDGEPAFVSRAHGDLLSAQGAMSAFTLPLTDADDQVIGAILLEHRDIDGIPAPVRDRARAIAALVGPILHQKRLNDRSWPVRALLWLGGLFAAVLGPARLGLKLTVLALAAAVYFFSTATTAFEVTADARLEGQVQRIISAPFDGYLVDQAVRPGDRVAEGAILAQLDDRDIRLQLLSTEAQLRQRLVEMNAAVAEGRRTDQALLDAQIAQVEAERDLLGEQIARTVLRAPFAGVIVSGDRTQQLGAAVSRGEELFVVAPLDDYRLRLAVAEGDIAEIAPDQVGQVRFAARPDDTFGFTVNRIMSVAEVDQGLNRFAVEGAIAPDGDRQGVLLPGMEGVARIGVDERLLIRVWTQDALDWLRLALWRWMP